MKKNEGQAIADKEKQKEQEQSEKIGKIAREYFNKKKEVERESFIRKHPFQTSVFDENTKRLIEKIEKNTDDTAEARKQYFARCDLIELEELQGVEVPACYLDIKDDYSINHCKFECEAKISRIRNNKSLPRLPKGAGTIRKLPKDDGRKRKNNFSVNALFISYSETHYEPVGYYYTWEDAYNGLLKFWEEEAKKHYPKYRSWFEAQFMKRWKKEEYTQYDIREMIGIALGYPTSRIDCNFKAKWGWWGTYNNFVPYYLSVIKCIGVLITHKALERDIVIDTEKEQRQKAKEGEEYLVIGENVSEKIEILYNLMIKERW